MLMTYMRSVSYSFNSSRNEEEEVQTSALSMCRTQRHFPSGDITWRADIGWLQRIVIVPMSMGQLFGVSDPTTLAAYTPVCPFSHTFFVFSSS